MVVSLTLLLIMSGLALYEFLSLWLLMREIEASEREYFLKTERTFRLRNKGLN